MSEKRIKKPAISAANPKSLSGLENMSACCIAKCHAANQIDLITHEINRLIKLRKEWKKRYQQCLDKMTDIAMRAAS